MEEKSKKIIYLEKVLRFMAIVTLKVHNPRIVGITGSVGKSSAKEAVFTVLKSKFKVRKNEENYNNEIGIPLTIIGAKTGGNNLARWIWVGVKWVFGIVFPFGYPKILVLEMAIDRLGDMKYLTSFIHPEVGILTDISSSHLEFFNSVDEIAQEKSILVKSLSKDGVAILNTDNEIIKRIVKGNDLDIVDFGIENEASIFASDIQFNYSDTDRKLVGLSFKLNQEGISMPIRLPKIIAKHHLYAVLAAVAVGNFFKINLLSMAEALKELKPPYGRMSYLDGIKGSSIIDDSYNSSPLSAKAAFETAEKIRASRRIAVLGDMLELGKNSERDHEEIVQEVMSGKFDLVALMGRRMKKAAKSIIHQGELNKKVIYFDNPTQAGEEVKKIVQEDDLILVKGSQSMRMEKVVEKLMLDSARSRSLLCRQSRSWKSKEFRLV